MATKIKKRHGTAHTYASGGTATFPGDFEEEVLRGRVRGNGAPEDTRAHTDTRFSTSKLFAEMGFQVVPP